MKNKDLDFIKWLCIYANGFEFIRKEDEEYYIGFTSYSGDYFGIGIYKRIIYPFLLQRAIEGINNINDIELTIYQNSCCMWIRYKKHRFYTEKSFYFKENSDKDMSEELIYDSIDQAKEATLKYIYDNNLIKLK